MKYDRSSRPWEDTSEYHELVQRLHEWEANLPHEHMWSPVLLKGYKASCQDLVSKAADMKYWLILINMAGLPQHH